MSLWLGILGGQTVFDPISFSYASQDIAAGSDSATLTPTVLGGSGGKTYTITSGVLPTGISLNASSGVITGPLVTDWGGWRDTTFGNGLAGANSDVRSFAVQSDGKVLIGGVFTTVNGTARGRIARLNSDGTLDTTFGNGLAGANSDVPAITVQTDGKVLIGGVFSTVNGTARGRIARLNSDGTLDTTFGNGLAGANSDVPAITVQTDGKVLIGGAFTTVNGTARGRIARLNSDGTLDTTFFDGVAGPANAANNQAVARVAVQSNGKVIVSGRFATIAGGTRNAIARLNSDGTLDTTFGNGLAGAGGYFYPTVWSFAVQSDGKVLIGGGFLTVNGFTVGNIARLMAGEMPTLPATVGVTVTDSSGSQATSVTLTRTVSPPTGLTATVGYQQVSYSWTAPAFTEIAIDDYILQRSPNGTTWTTIIDGVSPATSYTLTGLTDTETVWFRVATSNSGNTSAYTSPVTATTPAPEATGGTITYSGGNMIHTFTASGAFTPTVSIASASGLCAAGGYNGTGGGTGGSGAGGSGGQVTTGTQAISTARTITVGGVGGGTSSISGWLTSTGVGSTGPAGRNTAGVGAGGTAGTTSSISGASVVYGSSGGAGGFSPTTSTQNGGAGGSGAGNGGRGRSTSISGRDGGAASSFGSGGGGGSGSFTTSGGAGRQGVVIISYPAGG